MKDGVVNDESLQFLRQAHEQYTRSAGIALDYGVMLARGQKFAEAKRVVNTGIRNAFHDECRDACKNVLEMLEKNE